MVDLHGHDAKTGRVMRKIARLLSLDVGYVEVVLKTRRRKIVTQVTHQKLVE